MYPNSINKLINSFKKLPGVGQRTAERFVFYLLKSGKKNVLEIIDALNETVETIRSCSICWDFSDQNPCKICADKTRDNSVICVVSDSQHLRVIAETTNYRGMFHILRGVINSESNLENLKINSLFERVKKDKIKELILAFNPDIDGETTMLFLIKKINEINKDIKITKLARGLPMGADLLYADQITLSSALKDRIKAQ